MLEAGSRVSWVILIFASPRAERGHGVPIYFRILQHFDIITSSFLGNSLAKSELNSNSLHRQEWEEGMGAQMESFNTKFEIHKHSVAIMLSINTFSA